MRECPNGQAAGPGEVDQHFSNLEDFVKSTNLSNNRLEKKLAVTGVECDDLETRSVLNNIMSILQPWPVQNGFTIMCDTQIISNHELIGYLAYERINLHLLWRDVAFFNDLWITIHYKQPPQDF
ncbi:hypothetical protein NDU88_008096 [Pleurodeles waltl]|uniref:Uncharacterized protein n=1 Tax=Pleurodeles waltl TaxID=8319 RepID=A0AAV7QTK8_PLEWA|nr:hypothetical protein NDU88_008096 [Pleurodeles waltl]